jgi:hypothetical protein
MKTSSKQLVPMLVLGAALFLGVEARGQKIGQWDFNSSNLVQSAGSTLGDIQYADGFPGTTSDQTVFGSTTVFGISNINGTATTVMSFPAATNGQGYLMPVLPTANGSGSEVNAWTLIMDLLFPKGSDNQDRPIIDTDGSLTTGGGFVAGPDFAVSASDGIGAPSGPYFGSLLPNKWYRIGMVNTTNLVSFYINGTRVGTIGGSGLDGRFALSTTQPYLILSTILTNAAPGYVSSIQIRDVALNPGQMSALGGPSASKIPQTLPPVPAFIDTSSPAPGAVGVAPSPAISVLLNQGDTTVNSSSIKLFFDGALFPSSVAATPPTFQVTAAVTNLLDPSSVHKLSLVWSDSVNGTSTNSWTFTVTGYQSVFLPTPFYLENFDEVAEGSIPTGWVATNATTSQTSGMDLCDPTSDSYLNWLVINTNRLCAGGPCAGFECDTLNQPPIAVNGVLLDSIAHDNIAYFESDNRCNNCYGQVGMLFTSQIDCTGRTNVFVSFHSLYTQNQDNIGALEYSIDQGKNWLPVIYYLDSQSPSVGGDPDVIVTNGVVDVGATFETARSDQPAGGTNYAFFIAAPVSTNLIPYVAGRTNDDQVSGKRIETVRLTQADGQAHVMFRFVYAGTCSWYWGVDEFGLYEINTPVITTQPLSQTIDAGTPVTFTVAATSARPVTYQWQFNGINISGATNASYSISTVTPDNAGQFKVIVSNADGPTPSAPATLTVNTTPQILTQPYSQVAYVGASVTFNTTISGARPLNAQWYQNGTAVASGTSANLTIGSVKATDAGNYTLVISNTFGTATSVPAHLTVFSGPITNGLIAHLKFDNDYTDSSGNGTAGTAVGTPTFQTGIIGQAVHITSTGSPANAPDTNNYVTLGTPPQLQLGTNDFSISFWAKISLQNDDKPFISNKDWGSGGNPGWVLATEGGGMKWNLRDNVSSRRDSATVAPQLKDGNWHNVVVTFIRSSVGTIYVDGQTTNIGNVAPDPGNAIGVVDTALPVNIGQDGTGHYTDGGGGAAVDMLFDDLGIWNRALAPSEAASIYTAGQAGKDLSQAVVSTTPGRPTLTVTVSGSNLQLSWQGTATGRLQTTTKLNPAGWTDVPGTTGASSATVPITGASSFFRVAQ